MLNQAATTGRWGARPIQAALVRAFVFLVPIAASIACVHFASSLVPVPTSSLWLFLLWWVGLSGIATGILILVDRLSRRLLPLVALLKLSLVFPDRAPSRLRTALRSGTVESLEKRVAKARAKGREATPVEAAQRLMELVAALDVHDSLTRGHAERVRAYSQMIGEELKLKKTDRDLLNWAALLHDVGKLGIPTEILTKPGRLTDEEFAAVKRHPELGEELVAPLREWLGSWAEAVGDHHERWDGKGYPRGKAGEDIALAGRIVAVADVFDVITSARSYKEASSTIEARQELAAHAGTQFDERMVRAFLGISLGRLRFAMGPLAWLSHAPILGRVPLTPAVSSLSGALAVVATAITTGLVSEPDPGRAQSASRPAPKVAVASRPAPTAPRVGRRARPSPPAPKPRASPPVHPAAVRVAPHVESAVDEDSPVVVSLPGITGASDVDAVRISMPPHIGRSTVAPENALFYQPPADYNGQTTIGYEVCWQDETCALGEAAIVIRPVNDAPDVSGDASRTEEDEPVSIDVLDNDADVDGESLRISSVSGEKHGNALVRDGRITWSPALNFNGTGSFAYTVEDGQGATGNGAVSVVVAPVNDAPRAVNDVASVLENGTAVIDVLANDVDPDGDALSVASVGQPSTGTVLRNGERLRFTAADTGDSVSIEYVLRDANGATDRGSVSLTVGPVNDPPSFTAGSDRTVLEDSGAQTVAGWATAITTGPPDESSQQVTFLVSNTNGALFTPGGQPAVSANGTLTYTPAADANGRATVTVRPRDDGGTSDGGSEVGAPQTFSVVVGAVNDQPSFTAGSDRTVLEDSGAQTVAGWATAITTGPPDESSQQVTFLVSNTNGALFTPGGQPAVSANGTLTYTPAANANGSATVTVLARDDGGLSNGGSDVGAPQTFSIVVSAVNDAPTAVADFVSVAEDSPAGVTFNVLANDTDLDADLLSLVSYDGSTVTEGTLTDNGGGQFTFVPDTAFNGSQAFSYTVGDGNSGTDTAVVTIDVTAQPDAPVAADDAYATAQDTPVIRSAPGLMDNDGDEDGDTLTVQTTPVVAPSSGILSLSSDGSFTYTPNSGFVGTDSFTYRVDDGTGRTDDAVVTITVSSSLSTTLLYLGTSGPSADVWDLTTSPSAAASPVPDFEGDGYPGLSIYSGSGGEGEADSTKWHMWARPITLAPLVLNGPVTLQLWSTSDGFNPDDAGHPHVYLYDCLIGGLSCVKIAQNHEQVQSWNGGVSDWVYREITVGSVNRTIIVGRELRVRLQTSQNDLWVAMTAVYPSALAITGP